MHSASHSLQNMKGLKNLALDTGSKTGSIFSMLSMTLSRTCQLVCGKDLISLYQFNQSRHECRSNMIRLVIGVQKSDIFLVEAMRYRQDFRPHSILVFEV
jgi:hypothetical protein